MQMSILLLLLVVWCGVNIFVFLDGMISIVFNNRSMFERATMHLNKMRMHNLELVLFLFSFVGYASYILLLKALYKTWCGASTDQENT